MSNPVSLDHFIGTIQIMPYECEGYVNQQTGEIFMFSDEVMRAMKEERDLDLDKYPEWQQREIKKAKEAFEDKTDAYTMIPHRIGINDYDIMQAFCYGIQNERLSNKFLRLIRGSGAFRRFKNAIIQHGIEKDWYRYRDEAYKENAISWLEHRGIAYEDDVRPIK